MVAELLETDEVPQEHLAPASRSILAYGVESPGTDINTPASGNSFSFGVILQ